MSRPIWSLDDATVFVEGLDHPEGIAVHPDGSVWAGGEAGQIYRVESDGSSTDEVANTGGFILGIAFSPDASWLLACDVGRRCLWKIDTTTGEVDLFSDSIAGRDWVNPNYACFARDGRLWVSDSGHFKSNDGIIVSFEAGSSDARIWHEGPFDFANGLCLSADENTLFVVCSFLPGVERIQIDEDGAAGERSIAAHLSRNVPDGLALDADENLYISCYSPNRIFRLSPSGNLHLLLDDWDMHTLSNPTNIAFGGPNHDQLFTANLGRWHLTRIDCGVKGHKLPHL